MSRAATALTLLALASLVAPGCLAFHADPLPDEPAGATFLELEGTRVHYVDLPPAEGAAPRGTVVLVHGYGASLSEWLGVMPALAGAGYRAIAMDLRGHGWTTRPDADYSIAGQARLILALVERLGVDRFALVGHSWGSAVSLDVAMKASRRVSRVALYAGMFFEDQQPVVFAWARAPILGEILYGVFYPERPADKMAFAFYDPEAHITQDVVDRLEAYLDRPGTGAAALAGIRAMDFAALEAGYDQVAQPILLIWGREDQVTPLAYGERLANLLPNASLRVVPRCGHLPMIEAAVPTTRALLDFLAEGAP